MGKRASVIAMTAESGDKLTEETAARAKLSGEIGGTID